jgi:hypothetical protein
LLSNPSGCSATTERNNIGNDADKRKITLKIARNPTGSDDDNDDIAPCEGQGEESGTEVTYVFLQEFAHDCVSLVANLSPNVTGRRTSEAREGVVSKEMVVVERGRTHWQAGGVYSLNARVVTAAVTALPTVTFFFFKINYSSKKRRKKK